MAITRAVIAALAAQILLAVPALAQVSATLNVKAASDAGDIAAEVGKKGFARIIVQFAPAPGVTAADSAGLDAIKSHVAAMQDAIIASHFGSADAPSSAPGFQRGLVRFPITPGFAVNVNQAELNALANDPRVTTIHLDRLDKPTLAQVLPLIGMPAAYAAGGTGAGYAVAILDTGVQSNHEFLSGKVFAEACFSNGGNGGVSLCPNGTGTQTGAGAASPLVTACINAGSNLCRHGTHVAGIAAGLNTGQSTGEPTSGVAKNSRILAIQVFTRFNDSGSCGGSAPCVLTYTSDQISALNYVANNLNATGVPTVAANMSLGGGTLQTGACDGDSRKSIIDTLRTVGVATLIAAGNDGSTTGISAPGCISTAVTVGSTTKTDAVSSFSNMSNVVDLLAPGGESGGTCAFGANNIGILAPVPNAAGSTTAYACLVGTSMATPAAAGAFAAVKSACPTASISNIETALKNTGLNVADGRTGGTWTKPRIRVDQAINALGCTSTGLRVAHDFSGDGRSDVLWRSTAGELAFWFMNGVSANILSGPSVAPNWLVLAQKDFNNDGKHDLLWWNSVDGSLYLWLMNGTSIVNQGGLGNTGSWSVAGVGDFNADGSSDLLWRGPAGQTLIWFVNGIGVSLTADLGTVATNWTVSGVTDVDGDGRSDIVWRDANSGQVAIWKMNGGSVAQVVVLGIVSGNWQIVGTGDFDGNGRGDVLWRDQNGQTAVWFMNGLSVANIAVIGTVGTAWQVSQTGDYEGNSKSDILWRHTNAGTVAMWQMNGASVSNVAVLGTVGTNWFIPRLNSD